VILSAVYMLWMFQRVFYGKVTHEENATLPDLLPHEWASVIPLCAVALVMGVFPIVFLKPIEPAVTRIVERLQNTQTLRVRSFDSSGRFVSFASFERANRERAERLERSERSER
jgi:NADH-quinone oxidoreductase subunit M